MATPAQILANRENAQHSTGPKTDVGKAASSQNATRHGLTARGFVIPFGQENAFAHLEAALRSSLIPNGELQEFLFTRILESAWNLERCRLAEAQLSSDTDPLLADDPALIAKFARIAKYGRQYENSMYKAMKELRTLQTEAQFRNEYRTITDEELADPELYNSLPQSLPALCDFQMIVNSITRTRKTTALQNKADQERRGHEFLTSFLTPPVTKAA